MSFLMHRPVQTPPSLTVPAGACDAHAHIYGDLERYPMADTRGYDPNPASLEEYRAVLDGLGVDRAVIVQPSHYGLDNSCTLDAVRELGSERARAVVMLASDTTTDEVRRLHEQGARGVRFMPTGGAAMDDLRAVAAIIAPFGWHIQLNLPVALLAEMRQTILSLPVPVVLDHLGSLMTAEEDARGLDTVLEILDAGNWVKLIGYRASSAGYPYEDVAPLARTLFARAPDRSVWGTDWPHPGVRDHMPDDGEILDLLAEWIADAPARERVLVDNPARLYGF